MTRKQDTFFSGTILGSGGTAAGISAFLAPAPFWYINGAMAVLSLIVFVSLFMAFGKEK